MTKKKYTVLNRGGTMEEAEDSDKSKGTGLLAEYGYWCLRASWVKRQTTFWKHLNLKLIET